MHIKISFPVIRTSVLILLSFITTLSFSQTTSWKGLSSTWSSSSNWTNGVPTATTDVIIGDANFTGTANPSIVSTSVFKNITVGGVKAASVSINSSRTVGSVTIQSNGTLQLGKATLTILGDWIRNGGTYSYGSQSSEVFSGTNQVIGGSVATIFKRITFSANSNVTFSSNFSTNSGINIFGTLQPNPGINPKYTGSIIVYSGGNLKVNASLYSINYSANPTLNNGSTVEYSGTINQTIESSIAYKSLVISGSGIKTPEATFTLSSAAASEGNVTIESGTLDLSTFLLNRAASGGGSFIIEDGATLKIGGTNTFPINYTTRTLKPLSTVEYSGTNQTVTNLLYGNLVLSASSGAAIKTFGAGALTIAGNFSSVKNTGTSVSYTAIAAISFQGSVNVGVGTTFTGGAFTHTVNGDWINSGTFTNTSNTIAFTGNLNQSITSVGAFNNITVNKASGKINLLTDLTVRVLTFTKGSIVTNSYKVIVPSGGSVAGASATTGWVNGNLQKYFSTVGGGIFEVGGSTNYSPVTISFAGITTAGSLIAKATASTHPNINTSNIPSSNISRYWSVSKPATGALAFTTANMSFNWNVADNYSPLNAAQLIVAKLTSSVWTYPTITGTPTTSTISTQGISTLGDFAVGQITQCTISAGFNYSAIDFCSNGGTATINLNEGASAGNFTSSPAGLSLNPTTGAINLSSSAAGTYVVTNTVTVGICTTASTFSIDINPAPAATISYSAGSYCQTVSTAAVTRTGTIGGTYSSTPGLTINTSTGAVSPGTSTPGTYTVTYNIPAANGCLLYSTTCIITITPRNTASISYDGSPYCLNGGIGTVNLNGTAGGTFSSTAGLSLNAVTGAINLSASTAGTYTITYALGASSGCSAVTTTTTVTINSAVLPVISYSGSPACTSGGVLTVTQTGPAGGIFTSTVGLDINEETGEITLSTSMPGTYTVTYYVSPDGGCSASATTSVTIKSAVAVPIFSLGSTSTRCQGSETFSYIATAANNTGLTYTLDAASLTAGNTIVSSSGAVTFTSAWVGTSVITVSAAGCSGPTTATHTVTTAAVGIWTGVVDADYKKKDNWSCSKMPATSDNITIPGGLARYPVISSVDVFIMRNLTIQAGGSMVVNGTLQIEGSIVNSGSIAATTGTVTMKGLAAQAIPAGLFSNNTVYNLIIENTSNVSLNGALDILNILNIKAGALITNNYLTLKSSTSNTARVSQITSAAADPIVGDVTVERYVPGRRKYRLVASSVTSSTSATLTAGETSKSIWGNWQNQGVATPGVGTIITGGTAADGFDTQTTNPSLYTYNDATRRFMAFTSAGGKNTKFTPLKAGAAYYMFIYGDRINSITSSTPNPTVLRSKGKLTTGTFTLNSTSAIPLSNVVNKYTLIGNPYACTIDWKAVSKSGVSNTIWGWDANLSTTGGYVTVTATTSGAIVAPISDLIGISRYVQPGQGFFVRTTGTNPIVQFNESAKIDDRTTINSNVFRTGGVNEQPLIAVNLLYESAGKKILADGAVAAFDSAFSNEISDEDGIKMTTAAEGVGIENGTELLSIDARKMFVHNDTLKLSLANLTKPQYTLEVFANQVNSRSLQAYLEDAFLKTSTPLSLTDTNRITFTVRTAEPLSADKNRFKVVFRQMITLPVNFTHISAARKASEVNVEWNVASELNIDKYEVEHSTNGTTFTKVTSLKAKGNNNSTEAYSWLHNSPENGNNYYRIRAVHPDGQALYSKVVLVKLPITYSGMTVYPNPVRNKQINLQLHTIPKAQYTLLLYNSQSEKILQQRIDHNGGSSTRTIGLNKLIPPGVYFLQLAGESISYRQRIFIE